MHKTNRLFWEYCQNKYKRWFDGPNRVLEVGSMNINGSVRDHFTGFTEYVGVDWRPGPMVDVVCKAEDMVFDHNFDTVISASMLEHDPAWNKSLERMVSFVAPGGILLLSWGAAKNKHHCEESATDGQFHALPAGYVLEVLDQLGIYIHEFRYEAHLPFVPKLPRKNFGGWGLGEVVLVAFKNPELAVGDPIIEKPIRQDLLTRERMQKFYRKVFNKEYVHSKESKVWVR
jgi:SAM-dependent methyltransferase